MEAFISRQKSWSYSAVSSPQNPDHYSCREQWSVKVCLSVGRLSTSLTLQRNKCSIPHKLLGNIMGIMLYHNSLLPRAPWIKHKIEAPLLCHAHFFSLTHEESWIVIGWDFEGCVERQISVTLCCWVTWFDLQSIDMSVCQCVFLKTVGLYPSEGTQNSYFRRVIIQINKQMV